MKDVDKVIFYIWLLILTIFMFVMLNDIDALKDQQRYSMKHLEEVQQLRQENAELRRKVDQVIRINDQNIQLLSEGGFEAWEPYLD